MGKRKNAEKKEGCNVTKKYIWRDLAEKVAWKQEKMNNSAAG